MDKLTIAETIISFDTSALDACSGWKIIHSHWSLTKQSIY